ncbi:MULTISPECIES: transcriptional activator NhaR [Deefgea]|uniref:Transcriptional activator NhaR n=1 Tax=Deefgea chitinilytica TaxID=570276 RepID=A0ABS2CF15_9NEIS|nr:MULTISPECIES: transcriptional activator NhaR [Deefgea]MBM5572717.1 transcriptional activator NhaR [Deefgea chitinilytica]MBM9889953.1 transcriptional activator NhaR [Deefgea sp. CFH1-16]
MHSINYKHLYYFWVICKSGGVIRASERLFLTPQAVSGQLKALEEQVGSPLFRRDGRQLVLTEMGRLVQSYADEMFSLGEELQEAIALGPQGLRQEFRVGIGDMVPKTVAFELLQPALQMDYPLRLICREGRLLNLLADLATHKLDLVLADRPLPPEANIRGFNHLLGESTLSVLGTASLCAQWAGDFPQSLHGAPFLLPGADAVIRPRLEAWLERARIRPRIVAEFDDGALLKAFGKAGAGFFVVPTVLAQSISQEYQVGIHGKISELKEQFYAISVQRQLRHPAVIAVTERARHELFAVAV